MEKNIKDYLHLYIGCKGKVQEDDAELIGVDITDTGNIHVCYAHIEDTDWINFEFFKPILRPLSDITDEEKEHYKKITNLNYNEEDEWYEEALKRDIGNPEIWVWLLKQRFDLFGLIEAGLAIKKSTIN